MKNSKETIYQVMNMDEYFLVMFTNDKDEAEKQLKDSETACPHINFEIVEGVEYITTKCRGCSTPYANEQHDAHGITTGNWCEDCYEDESIYPYRKDKYPTMETHGFGEVLGLDDDY